MKTSNKDTEKRKVYAFCESNRIISSSNMMAEEFCKKVLLHPLSEHISEVRLKASSEESPIVAYLEDDRMVPVDAQSMCQN